MIHMFARKKLWKVGETAVSQQPVNFLTAQFGTVLGPFVDEETDRQQANQHIFCWQFSAVKRWTTGAPGLLPVLSVSSRTWGMWGIRGFLATSSTDLEWSHS